MSDNKSPYSAPNNPTMNRGQQCSSNRTINIGTTPSYGTQRRKMRNFILVMASLLRSACLDPSFFIQGPSALQWGSFSRSSIQASWSSRMWRMLEIASLLRLKRSLSDTSNFALSNTRGISVVCLGWTRGSSVSTGTRRNLFDQVRLKMIARLDE